MRTFLCLVAVALVVAGCADRAGDTGPVAASFTVGDCVDISEQVTAIDCYEPAAVYEVGVVLARATAPCPSGDYRKYEQEDGLDDFSLCLLLNALQGDCFSGLDGTAPTRTNCAAADVEVSFIQHVAGATCPEGTPLVYSEPAPGRTVCLTDL
jgi:hypothetical protein